MLPVTWQSDLSRAQCTETPTIQGHFKASAKTGCQPGMQSFENMRGDATQQSYCLSPSATLVRRRGISVAECVMVLAIIASTIGAGWFWQEHLAGPHETKPLAARQSDFLPAIYSVAISPDQKHALSVGLGGILRSFQIDSQDCVDEFETDFTDARSLIYSPDGRYLLISAMTGEFQIWDFQATKDRTRSVKGHEDEVINGAFHPTGKQFATFGRDRKLTVWSTDSLKAVWTAETPAGPIYAGTFSNDGEQLITGDLKGGISCWDSKTGIKLWSRQFSKAVDAMDKLIVAVERFPDSDDVLIADRAGAIQVWSLQTQQCQVRFETSGSKIRSIALSTDGATAISGESEGNIVVWNSKDGKRIKSWKAHSSAVMDLACSIDNARVASVGWDGQLKIWDF